MLVVAGPGLRGAFCFGAGLGAGWPGIVMPGGRQIAPRHCCVGVVGVDGVDESDDEPGALGAPGLGGFDGFELDDEDDEDGRFGSGMGLVGITPVAYAPAQARTLVT